MRSVQKKKKKKKRAVRVISFLFCQRSCNNQQTPIFHKHVEFSWVNTFTVTLLSWEDLWSSLLLMTTRAWTAGLGQARCWSMTAPSDPGKVPACANVTSLPPRLFNQCIQSGTKPKWLQWNTCIRSDDPMHTNPICDSEGLTCIVKSNNCWGERERERERERVCVCVCVGERERETCVENICWKQMIWFAFWSRNKWTSWLRYFKKSEHQNWLFCKIVGNDIREIDWSMF